MAWTAPATWVSGAILTAAQLNTQLRDNLLAGGPIYTNEAARDAAITAPFEGQRAYLTAPTVPAATGTTTAVPSGVTTIYNGSVWVCTTPISAHSITSGTTTSTSYVTTLTGDGTAISVTLVTGTTALLTMTSQTVNGAAGNNNFLAFSVSGATTVAAADGAVSVAGTSNIGTYQFVVARTFIYTGLTAGTNTFTLNYRTEGNTATYRNRNLTVQGVA